MEGGPARGATMRAFMAVGADLTVGNNAHDRGPSAPAANWREAIGCNLSTTGETRHLDFGSNIGQNGGSIPFRSQLLGSGFHPPRFSTLDLNFPPVRESDLGGPFRRSLHG